MNLVRRFPVALVVIAAAMVSGCAATPASPVRQAGSDTPASAATTIPTPDLGRLEARPHMPALVDGELDGCLPLCRGVGAEDFPIPAGRYQTQNFFGGYLTASFGEGWTAGEDSTGELKIFPPGEDEYGAGFTVDAYPVRHEKRVDGVANTAAAIVGWLRANPDLVVSEPRSTTIGTLPATSVDIRLADGAPMEDAGCGAPCVNFIGFEQWSDVNGIRDDDVYRFTWSDVMYSGTPHVLGLYVEGRDAAHLQTMVETLAPVIESVEVPARPGGGSS